MSSRGIAAGLLVLVALGCELTRELGVYTGAGEESVALETDTGSDAQEDGTSDGDSESGGGEGDSGDPGDGDPGDGDGEPGDGDPDGLCRIDGSEDPCEVCLEFLCCEFLGTCDADVGCNCMFECLPRSDAVTCAGTCAPGPAYFQLLQCQMTSCGGVCD
ncbi:MAG: hypothetical protein R6X02_07625 [Enhygromyxa sp.]